MTPNFIGPYFVRINYHGALAPHTMTLPTRNWATGAGAGSFTAWDASNVPALTMIPALVNLMLPMFPSDTVFDNFTIFRQLLPTDTPFPEVSGTLGAVDGTNTGGSWAGAVQMTLIAHTALAGIAKLTLLDACSENDFNPIFVLPTALQNLFDEWADDGNAWSGRDNAQVTVHLKTTININQKLRKEYRLD